MLVIPAPNLPRASALRGLEAPIGPSEAPTPTPGAASVLAGP